MWKQKIYKLLEINQIPFEINHSVSVFETIFLPQSLLYLHLIDLQTFQQNQLSISYFQAISDKLNAQNERIIHLWEDVYATKRDLVEARILVILGKFIRLHARHCIIERIDKTMADKFLDENHLQGTVKAKFKYGLFLKSQYVEKYLSNQCPTKQLIAVATFSGGRLMKEGIRHGKRSYELIRFATLSGYAVMGGLDKLLKVFELGHNPDDIMSYADRDWSDGRSYDRLGFTKIENSLPQMFFVTLLTMERSPVNGLRDEMVDRHLEIFNAGSIKYIKSIVKKPSIKITEGLVVESFKK